MSWGHRHGHTGQGPRAEPFMTGTGQHNSVICKEAGLSLSFGLDVGRSR